MTEMGIIVAAYLIGSIPTAYIFGRIFHNIDIRHYGSGNIGTSNVWAHVGKLTVIPVATFDAFVKGSLPVASAQILNVDPWISVGVGLAAVAGHNWSIYMKFTGGRGIIVTGGVLLVLSWQSSLALASVSLVGYLVFRSAGLWVGIAVLLLPLWSIIMSAPDHITILSVLLVIIAIVKRLVANRSNTINGIPLSKLYYRRLLFDRDVIDRDEWVKRSPIKD